VPIATINPATGPKTVKDLHPRQTDAEVDAAIARAHDRFLDYRHSTTFAPAGRMGPTRTADLLEKEADETAAG